MKDNSFGDKNNSQHLMKSKVDYKSHQYYIYLMVREDFTYTQILVSMLQVVLCTKFKMVNQKTYSICK